MEKVRTIITQDAEVDDQNSLRHFLFYANEVELLGIVQTSSKFHWIGVPGAVRTEQLDSGDFAGFEQAPFDRPYRWPGTDWMFRVVDDYAKDYPNLCRHAEGYPSPEHVRSLVKIGNIGYEGEMEHSTEGSELIRKYILDDDDRKLYIQIWGGTNTVARALMDIQQEYEGSDGWEALHERITNKVVLTACGEQDGTYRSYIAEEWPQIPFIKTLQMQSYAYAWFCMPEGESKDTLRAAFMKSEILRKESALAGGYCTWLDGVYYEGELPESQFGANPDITKEWFGARFGFAPPEQYDFLSEGDSPTFFALFDWGFRTLEDFSYGGMAGRYQRKEDAFNSKGEKLNLWDVCKDVYRDRDGNESLQESMWAYVADIQRDFAARVAWAAGDAPETCDHAPGLTIREGLDVSVPAGTTLTLHADMTNEDNTGSELSWRIYKDASSACAEAVELKTDGDTASVVIPAGAKSGEQIHLIAKAQANGAHRLVHYQQVIITVSGEGA